MPILKLCAILFGPSFQIRSSQMQYHFKFGAYIPSYLLMKINTPDPISNIKYLQPADQSVFIHEYTHYLQNITGCCGVSQIWSTFDQLRQVISNEQKNKEKEFTVPLSNDVIEKQKLFIRTLRTVSGSKYLSSSINDKNAHIQNVRFVLDENFQKLNPKAKIYFVEFDVIDTNGGFEVYKFGDTAVSETMAYLMETRYFGESEEINDFPYRCCQKLGNWMKTDILKDDQILFALCDISLVSPYPGRAFYQILLEIAQKNLSITDAEEIYKLGEEVIRSMGFNIWDEFKTAKEGAIIVLEDIFNHDIFKNTLSWLKYILESGYQSRLANPKFMLQLYREPNQYDGLWNNVMAQFGTPMIYNYFEERFFSSPLELREIEHEIEPLFLIASQQVYNTLLKGYNQTDNNCGLFKCCKKSPNASVDERCIEQPWERTKDKKLCAYARSVGFIWAI